MGKERFGYGVFSFVMGDIWDGPNMSVPTNMNLLVLAVKRDISPVKLKA